MKHMKKLLSMQIVKTFCILVEFPVQINTIKMRLSIVYLRGHRLQFPNYNVFLTLRFVFTIKKGVSLDEMPHAAAFHLGLHFSPKHL